MAGADIGTSCIDKFTIDLVGEEIQVVFLHQITYLVHLTARVEVARGIVGIADEDSACTLVDELFELLHLRQREAFFYSGGDGTNDCSCRDGKCHIVGIGRFGHDNLVARIQTGQKGEEHSLRTAAGDDDVIGREVDMVLLIILHQLGPVAQIALAGTVFQYLAVDVSDGIDGRSGCRQVRLSDIQMINMDTALLGCVGQGSELPDG